MAAADFGVEPWDHGASRIDAITALERLVRVAQARIVEQVDSLYRDRLTHDLPGATDHRLWVAAEVAMARNVSPTAGRSLFQLSMGLRLMPHARRAFGDGVISEPTVRAIVRELELAPEDTMRLVDDGLAEHLPGLTPKRAANLVRELLVTHDQVAAEERSRKARADQCPALPRCSHHAGQRPGGLSADQSGQGASRLVRPRRCQRCRHLDDPHRPHLHLAATATAPSDLRPHIGDGCVVVPA